MFADDTNLFYSELSNTSHSFNSNMLSLNPDRTKFTLLHKARQRDNIPLALPTLKINNTLIKQIDHAKFIGVLFDENLT